ncbi:transcriptional repressor LexA [Pseudogracilibacillus sp. SE30717A]|uniref:transcriptional repressor LexA n=1 Tax=Pseudogracilibacillus sp. SE30717A TaxID=3098293 RepID=UPI00300E5150
MQKLSKRQQMIFDFIKSEVEMKGYPPSVREIAKAVGLASSSTVHGHLERIENKGYIRRDPTKPRAIEILDQSESNVEKDIARYAPLIGKVTAGVPITAIENVDEYTPVPSSMAHTEDNLFVLEVVGESMINAGILSGDRVIVKQQSTADNGEIVVAMTEDDEATVKRFYKESDHFRLQPENDSMEPLILKNVSILGKVVGLYRNF